MCSAFLVEGRWFASGQLPSAEEYLENGIVSSGVHVVLVHVFFLLGHGLTREAVELVNSYPPIISSSATILRLWDDLGTAKVINFLLHFFSFPEKLSNHIKFLKGIFTAIHLISFPTIYFTAG